MAWENATNQLQVNNLPPSSFIFYTTHHERNPFERTAVGKPASPVGSAAGGGSIGGVCH